MQRETVSSKGSVPKKVSHSRWLNNIIETQSRLVEASFDLDAFMELIVQQMHALTPSTGVVVELVEGDEMVYRCATGTVKAHVGLRLPKEGSISGLCVEREEILLSHDTEKDPRVNLEAVRRVKARSLVVAPLFNEGRAVGVLKIMSKYPQAFTPRDVHTLQLMAGFIGAAMGHQILYQHNQKLLAEQKELIKKLQEAEIHLRHLANSDTLTHLPNRSLLMAKLLETLDYAKQYKQLFGLMYLDIDHFKNINDTLGHDVGDELLQLFSNRLLRTIRSYDIAARWGGDEFVIIVKDLKEHQDAVKVAEKIIATMEKPFSLKNQILQITVSIGIAFYQGEELTADELLKQADQALYAAKKAGRNCYFVYSQLPGDHNSD